MKYPSFRHLSQVAASVSMIIALSACTKNASPVVTPEPTASVISTENLKTNASPINDMVANMRVIRNDKLKSEIDGINILGASTGDASKFLKTSAAIDERVVYQGKFPTSDVDVYTTDAANDTLIVGLPIGDLGEERILGGVITAVSAFDNEDLGNLKLSDFPMTHGKLMIANLDTNAPQLLMVGCLNDCSEVSPRLPLFAFPITAIDSKSNLLMIDISAVGRNLDFMAIADPDGEGTGLKSTGSVAKSFDYSSQTIVFDIESKMTAADPENNPLPDTTITVRWYLKSSSAFDSAFTPRKATEGVGFFMSDTAKDPNIKRWSLARYGDAGIKYYLKHIPTEWQPAFASAFDEWNEKFQATFGRKIFDYEFIPEGDARNDLLVTGDIRYNIVEWDLNNLATYGGLGPCESNEYTGETISSNVLIQGPTIMKLYTDWYKVSDQVKDLQARGKTAEAATLLRDFSHDADASVKAAEKSRLTLGKNKSFKIHSQLPEIADPYAQRNDFDELPPNVDFKTYMYGYFHDMLTHELGHNLGLRHNFRGNMGATDTGVKGSTSRSVMEYLGRRYRYLDGVGEYDVMALQYGYTGVKPTHTDWFCTDEDKWSPKSTKSAECSADDATSDPFNFFEWRLTRALDYLTARGESYAPVWAPTDMARELGIALNGMLSYASANDASAAAWTNFFSKPARPADSKGLTTFVVARLKQQLCDPNLDLVIAGKYDPAAQALTKKQIEALREIAINLFSKNGVDLGFDISCAPATAVATK